MAGDIEVIWVRREPNYFCEEDWTIQISLIRQENFFPIVMADSHAAGHRTTSEWLLCLNHRLMSQFAARRQAGSGNPGVERITLRRIRCPRIKFTDESV
jgi:hypothetical protein